MKKYFLILFIGIFTVSCSLDNNQDPNNVLADDVLPDLRLSAAETSAYAVLAGSMNGLGNYWTNSWSGNHAQYGNPTTTENNLELTTSFYQGVWQNTYKAVSRFEQIINHVSADETPNEVAIAKVQKAFYMQYIVDLYGDAPYSEAFQEAELSTPVYDKDVDIYAALVDELLDARKIIDESAGDPIYAVESYSDPIYKGDMDEWMKFANTVLLKFAVRLSNTTDSKGVELKNKIISELANAEFITGNVSINPGYNNDSDAGQNPLYNSFGRGTAAGSINSGGYQLMTASDHIIKSLEGHSSKITSGVSDPRIGFLFTSAIKFNGVDNSGPTGYYGYIQGHNNDRFKEEYGVPVDGTIKPVNDNLSFKGGSFYDYPGGASEDGYLMMLSESELLQAEAALRGYAGFDNAQAHFENSITASFEFDEVENEASSYISAISSKPKVGWTGGDEDKIAAIQYQRWIALTNYNGLETFINYLRTGYPETPLATTTSRPNKPWRLLYPEHEYSSNSANVPDMALDEIFSKNERTPFIYK